MCVWECACVPASWGWIDCSLGLHVIGVVPSGIVRDAIFCVQLWGTWIYRRRLTKYEHEVCVNDRRKTVIGSAALGSTDYALKECDFNWSLGEHISADCIKESNWSDRAAVFRLFLLAAVVRQLICKKKVKRTTQKRRRKKATAKRKKKVPDWAWCFRNAGEVNILDCDLCSVISSSVSNAWPHATEHLYFLHCHWILETSAFTFRRKYDLQINNFRFCCTKVIWSSTSSLPTSAGDAAR